MWSMMISGVLAVVQKLIPDFGQKAELEKELTRMAGDVLTAETKSESWLTRCWRPWMMFGLTNLILVWGFNNFIVRPYLMIWGIVLPEITVPPELWHLMGLGFGVYGGARTIEKMLEMLLARK